VAMSSIKTLINRDVKVHIFWEGHKIIWNLHLTFDCVFFGQKLGEDFARFLWPSIYELYQGEEMNRFVWHAHTGLGH